MRVRIFTLFGALLTIATLLAAGPASACARPGLCGPAGSGPAGSRPHTPVIAVGAQPGQAYIHTSAADNSVESGTFLENPALNGQPNTRFFTIDNLFPYGFGTQADHPQGVDYASSFHRWAIINDDGAPMTLGRAWNVFIPPQDGNVLVTISSALNSAGPLTRIKQAPFDDPNAVIFVQHVYQENSPAAVDSPAGAPANFYTPTVAVTYNAGAGFWAIRNADGSNFPPNITFDVLKASPSETAFVHTVTPASAAFGYATALDSPLLNGNPDAQVLVTQNFGTGLANNHRVGVGYFAPTQRWYIFNRDLLTMPVGLEFNVLVIPPKTGYFLQTVTALNTSVAAYASAIDNPDLNNNPDALVYVSHNYNPPESANLLTEDHPIGVLYFAGAWYVVNLDLAPLKHGLTFNLYYTWPRGNSFSVSASASNASGSAMTLNSPLLNSNPKAVPIITHNDSPAGLVGANYLPPVALRYQSSFGLWQVFNNSGPSFAITQTYNVLIAPGSFVVTATAPIGSGFLIDNPLTNNNPWAMVFASARDSSGFNQKYIGVSYDTVFKRWGIVNENLTAMTAGSVYDVFVTRFRAYLPAMYR